MPTTIVYQRPDSRSRRGALTWMTAAVFLATAMEGMAAMASDSKSDLELTWEWPADRTPERKIAVRVDSIRKAGKGLFGIEQSPSLGRALPDPVDISGRVTAGASELLGREVTLRLPSLELPPGIEVGGIVALGLIGESVCICIAKATVAEARDAATWLDSWRCGA